MRYAARDLLLLPGQLSAARIPLAFCFPFFVANPLAAFLVLGAAGLTDMLDGWYARKYGQMTATGAAFDPITDKIFVLTVAITLIATHRLSLAPILLLSTREIIELPLVLWALLGRRDREQPRANVAGKIATCCQFAAATAALFRSPFTPMLVGVAAGAGLVSGLLYWQRELSAETKGAPSRASRAASATTGRAAPRAAS